MRMLLLFFEGRHALLVVLLWMFIQTRVVCVSNVTHEVLDSIYTKYILGTRMIIQYIIFALVLFRFLPSSFVRCRLLQR